MSDTDLIAEVTAALDDKYRAFRTARSDMPADTKAHYSVGVTTIEMIPDTRILSWDNARLNLD